MRKAAILLLATMAPAFSQKAHVEGRVTDVSGQPLAKAMVRMSMATAPDGAVLPPVYVSSTDASGTFVFDDLDPDRYTLSVERVGYLNGSYSFVIDVRPGQTVSGIAIKLTPEAVISGRIADEDGDPYPNALVVLCRWTFTAGQRRQVCNSYSNTGPDGSFIVGRLPAGRYYLGAQDSRTSGSVGQRELPGRKGPEESYVLTYYPGVPELSAAAALDLTAGGQLRGMDFRLRKSRVFRIAGKVVGAPGGPVNAVVSLLPLDPRTGTRAANGPQTPSGAFEFNRLLPGSYVITASAAQTPPLFGRQVVTIGNGNVENLTIQLTPGADITIRLNSEDSGTTQPSRARITITSFEQNIVRTAQQRTDGTQLLSPLAPSSYRIALDALENGVYVKSMRFGDQNVTRKPLDLTSGVGGILEVVLSPHAAELNGMTTPGVTVTLWDGPDFIRSTSAGPDGRYRFTNLPPGDYHAAAWEKIDAGLSDLPEFLTKFEERATRVRLNENERQNTDLTVLKRDDIDVEANAFR